MNASPFSRLRRIPTWKFWFLRSVSTFWLVEFVYETAVVYVCLPLFTVANTKYWQSNSRCQRSATWLLPTRPSSSHEHSPASPWTSIWKNRTRWTTRWFSTYPFNSYCIFSFSNTFFRLSRTSSGSFDAVIDTLTIFFTSFNICGESLCIFLGVKSVISFSFLRSNEVNTRCGRRAVLVRLLGVRPSVLLDPLVALPIEIGDPGAPPMLARSDERALCLLWCAESALLLGLKRPRSVGRFGVV